MPFIQPFQKPISEDRPYEDIEWFGDTIWNGYSYFNNGISIGTLQYVRSENDLPTIEIAGILYTHLTKGRYRFVQPTTLCLRPIYVDFEGVGGTLEIQGTFIYVDGLGSGVPFINGDVTSSTPQLAILRLTNAVIVFGGGTGLSAVSVTSSGNDGIFISEFTGLISWPTASLIDNCSIVQISALQLQACAGGVTIYDTTNLITLRDINMTSSVSAMTYISISASTTKFPLISINSATFVPVPHGQFQDYGFFIDRILVPSVQINGGVLDARLTGGDFTGYFDPNGYDETDPEVIVTGVKGVANSRTSINFHHGSPLIQETIVPAQWIVISMPAIGVDVSNAERISLNGFYTMTVESIEPITIVASLDSSLSGASAINVYEIGIATLGLAQEGTADDLTDTITIPGHGYIDDDILWFADNNVTGMTDYEIYYVINSTTNTFQLSTTLSGTALNIASGAVTASIVEIEGQPSKVTVGNNLGSLVSTRCLINARNGTRVITIIRNTSGTKNISTDTLNVVIYS